MDFRQDETQRAVAELAAEVLTRELGAEPTGTAYPGEPGYPEAVWKALAQAGLLSLAVPAELGGDGLGMPENAVVLAAAGRHAAAVPLLATLAMGTLPIAVTGTERQRAELLAEVASGSRVFTAALREPGIADPTACRCRADRAGDELLVSGTKVGVQFASAAHRILLPVAISGGGAGVLLLDPAAPGVRLTRTPSSSGAPEFTLRLDQVRVPEEDLLGADHSGRAVAQLGRFALAGICATADGALAGTVRLTAEHVRTREQFGKPLASFQAVAQQIADVYICARAMHLASTSACWRLGDEHVAHTAHTEPEDLLVAAYWLTEEVPVAMQICQHLHGGIGVDTGYPMHHYYELVKDLCRLAGGAQHCLDRLGETVGAA